MAETRLQGQYGRLELDAEFMGEYMRDAISHGGYRAALDHYEGTEAATPQLLIHRLRARGWLLGRLALDDGVAEWMEEARACSEFDHILSSGSGWNTNGGTITHQQREEGNIVRIEPVDAVPPTPHSVPQWVWAIMLVLDAVGPVYSRAGLNAAVTTLQAEVDRNMCNQIPCGQGKYDPLGNKSYQIPKEYKRWIISDIDAGMMPLNEPHYYYDLTDEGKVALDHVRRDKTSWSKAAVKAASGLADKALPDILEEACNLGDPPPTMDCIRNELGGLIRAWDSRKAGGRLAPASQKDAILAGLAPASKWQDYVADVQLEHALFVMCAIKMVSRIASSGKPASGGDGVVVRTLIGKMQDQCRELGVKIVGVPKETRRPQTMSKYDDVIEGELWNKWRRVVGGLPASISDLYYCLSEYCKRRGLADDPVDRPLAESLTEREKAALIEVLLASPPPGYEAANIQEIQRPARTGPLSNG